MRLKQHWTCQPVRLPSAKQPRPAAWQKLCAPTCLLCLEAHFCRSVRSTVTWLLNFLRSSGSHPAPNSLQVGAKGAIWMPTNENPWPQSVPLAKIYVNAARQLWSCDALGHAPTSQVGSQEAGGGGCKLCACRAGSCSVTHMRSKHHHYCCQPAGPALPRKKLTLGCLRRPAAAAPLPACRRWPAAPATSCRAPRV